MRRIENSSTRSSTLGPVARETDQDILRNSLTRANKYLSAKAIIALADLMKTGPLPGDRALRDFLNKTSPSNLTREHHDSLAEVWLYSRFGRAFGLLGVRHLPALDRLVDVLANGARTQPAGIRAAGSYFMYHGSYLKEGHFVVRVLRIGDSEHCVLEVTDYVTDMLTAATDRLRIADGAMVFSETALQILLSGNENKRGLSLIIGTDISHDGSLIDRVTGGMLVLNKDTNAAYRRCLLVREANLDLGAMGKETGIFLWDELRPQHRDAFMFLRRVHLKEAFADPVLELPERD